MGFGGNRMPVSVGLTYNANDTFPNEYYVEKGPGYGWRTNLNQRIYKWTADLDGDGTVEDSEYYYAWEDGDGTTHYFENVSTGVYTDEDGLGLTLNTSGSDTSMTWTITDKGDNVSYFDTQGRLYKQENNQEEKSSIQITYTADDSYRISTVTDGDLCAVGREVQLGIRAAVAGGEAEYKGQCGQREGQGTENNGFHDGCFLS